MAISRRGFIKAMGCCAAGAGLGTPTFSAAGQGAQTDKKFIFINLKGGCDFLNVLIPHFESNYTALRPGLAIPAPGASNGMHANIDIEAIDLGSFGSNFDGAGSRKFNLHPVMHNLKQLIDEGSVRMVHAASHSPVANRSHFEMQDLLEMAMREQSAQREGYMNRLLDEVNSASNLPGLAISNNTALPLALRGSNDGTGVLLPPHSIPNAANIFETLGSLYQDDPFLTEALQGIDDLSRSMENTMEDHPDFDWDGVLAANFQQQCELAGIFLGLSPELAPMSVYIAQQGYDTHANQEIGNINQIERGRLRRLLRALDEGIGSLVSILKGINVGGGKTMYDNTLIFIVSEFGRSVVQNTDNGCDHGYGGGAILLNGTNGSVGTGYIQTVWPGMADHQLTNNDLMATIDIWHDVLGPAVQDHFSDDLTELTDAQLRTIFPALDESFSSIL